MTIVINDYNDHYIKTWSNWDGKSIPQVGDTLIIRYGDCNELAQSCKVKKRVFDEARPDVVYLTTNFWKGGDND